MTDRLSRKSLFLVVAPALTIGLIYELTLRHRHDYTGHYAAGYGATLVVAMICLGLTPRPHFQHWAMSGVLPLCIVCILLGVVTESTIFRLAKFDEVDFCNQSIGAVLAVVGAMTYVTVDKPSAIDLVGGFTVGILFLAAGARFAVA